jgi:hypothetical protein
MSLTPHLGDASFWLSETIQISAETTMHRNSSFPMDRRNHMAVMCKSGFWLTETKDRWFSPPPPNRSNKIDMITVWYILNILRLYCSS